MSKDREYDEKMEQKRKSTPFGQAESAAARQLGTAFGQTYNSTTLPRKKASDTSRMNKVYKPKSSPGPAMNTLNLYGASKSQTLNKYGSPSPRTKPQSLNMYGAPTLNAKPKPKSNFNYTAPKAGKSKSKAKAKDTSFKKSGVAGVLKSPEAKKFRDTFRKKGLLPALRGK
jgi:hypothetical protein